MADALPHLPILRGGTPYRSLDTQTLVDVRDGSPVATVSRANRGLIAHDLNSRARWQRELAAIPIRELFERFREAGALFAEGVLPVDPVAGIEQSADDYVRQLSATTGLPQVMARANMQKIRFVFDNVERVLHGLSRDLDFDVLDRGWLDDDGRFVSFQRQADALGAVLPSNSPGVHSLWIPCVAMKIPVVLKPGGLEPWSPLRIAMALSAAGVPKSALGFYPADHGGSHEILLRTDRSLLFGDAKTVGSWADDPRVELHGPGWSKVVFAADAADGYRDHVDLMVASVADNGGRSCINASGVWTAAHGREIAEALAERLAAIEPRALDDPAARLAAFPNPAVARAVSDHIDRALDSGGAVDLTAKYRRADRAAEVDGCTFLRPTVVWCEDPSHPLASAEFLFPFVSVVETPEAELLERMGPTLVVTALTENPEFVGALLRSPNVERLNLGPYPTTKVSWDQPHEGNLFDHLYRQRAFQTGAVATGS